MDTPRRARKTTVQRLVRGLEATLEFDPQTLYIYSPRGTVFSATGTSTIAIGFADAFGSWRPVAYGEAVDLLDHGVESAPADYRGWWE